MSDQWSAEHGGNAQERGVLPAAAAWCARWLIIGLAGYVLIRIAGQLQAVVIPVVIAVLLAALLAPLVGWLHRHRWPRWLATTVVLVGGLALVGGVLSFTIGSFIAGLPALTEQLTASLQNAHDWALRGPLQLDPGQLASMQQQVTDWLASNQQRLAQGALTTAISVGGAVTAAILVLFSLVFFLHDGNRIWRGISRIAGQRHQDLVEQAGRRSFGALTAYARATSMVATVDAIGIGLGLWIVGVPLAGPLTALVFLGGFLPVIGALVTSVLAVLVTLVTQGLVPGLIILVVALLVQQLEGNVLQPWLLGDAVQIHPLGVVLAVTGGATLAGVLGALLAVPVVTTVRTVITTWQQHARSGSQHAEGTA